MIGQSYDAISYLTNGASGGTMRSGGGTRMAGEMTLCHSPHADITATVQPAKGRHETANLPHRCCGCHGLLYYNLSVLRDRQAEISTQTQPNERTAALLRFFTRKTYIYI